MGRNADLDSNAQTRNEFQRIIGRIQWVDRDYLDILGARNVCRMRIALRIRYAADADDVCLLKRSPNQVAPSNW